MEKVRPRLVFTGGGTAGHVMPCVALMEQLKDRFEIHYIGSKGGMEREIISKIPYAKYHAVTAVKLIRKLSPKNLLIPFKLVKGVLDAKKILRELKPAVVFSKGGFVALPVALAAKCPLIAHESDKTAGLSNRLIRRKAKYFCTSFECASKKLKNGVFTGLPVRQSLYKPRAASQGARPVLLIMGGSLGAKAINDCVEKSIDELTENFEVVHITGRNKSIDSLKGRKNYTQVEFYEDMGGLYAQTAVALSRGGGTALFELIALKIPSVIVPLPKGVSRGDQVDNAAYFGGQGLCRVLNEQDLSPQTLINAAKECYNDKELKSALLNAKNIDGTKKIVELIEKASLVQLNQSSKPNK